MKNILLPTDFSPCSVKAILYALTLFKGTSCTFHLLSVYKASTYTSGDLMQASSGDSLYDILISESKLKLEKLIAEMEKHCPGEDYTYKAITQYNVFTDSISKFLEVEKIDLIVMGTDGASDTQERIFGSHTLRVIRKVDSPVLIIPEKATSRGLHHVLLSLEATIDLKEATLEPILDLFGNHSFELEILKIHDPDLSEAEESELKKKLKDQFEIYNPAFHLINDVALPDAISTLVQSKAIDMNVLPVKKEVFLERLFGSNLSKIIYGTKVPLLIIHSKEFSED